jgi:hypothetical protein
VASPVTMYIVQRCCCGGFAYIGVEVDDHCDEDHLPSTRVVMSLGNDNAASLALLAHWTNTFAQNRRVVVVSVRTCYVTTAIVSSLSTD